jgi:hypothetical protein
MIGRYWCAECGDTGDVPCKHQPDSGRDWQDRVAASAERDRAWIERELGDVKRRFTFQGVPIELDAEFPNRLEVV